MTRQHGCVGDSDSCPQLCLLNALRNIPWLILLHKVGRRSWSALTGTYAGETIVTALRRRTQELDHFVCSRSIQGFARNSSRGPRARQALKQTAGRRVEVMSSVTLGWRCFYCRWVERRGGEVRADLNNAWTLSVTARPSFQSDLSAASLHSGR